MSDRPDGVPEAELEDGGSGLAPVGDGWFVVNVADTAWLTSEAFGARAVFEGSGPVFRNRPEVDGHQFADLGLKVQILQPGQPSGLYHSENGQEDFLVLAGECLLLVDGEERRLRTWDFFHCPPDTEHVFVGAGDGPCVIFMAGRRLDEKAISYPESELARRHGAGAETATNSPDEAYSPFPHWQPGRPRGWDDLPWAGARRRSA